MHYIAFDSHKKYTLATVELAAGGVVAEKRIEHQRGAITLFLNDYPAGTEVAVETIGNWYWIVDEIEQAGMVPRLVHARRAKMMMASVNKTDKLDNRGMNRLQRAGTLPSVWIPPAELRDKRELLRTRMMFVQQLVRLKNRIHAVLDKHAVRIDWSDAFGVEGFKEIAAALEGMPEETRFAAGLLLEEVRSVKARIEMLSKRIEAVLAPTAEVGLLKTIPGIGPILGAVVQLEVGDVGRFPSASHLASYAGTAPRVHSSGGKTRIGQLRSDVNRYLKWAFIEAANGVCINRRKRPNRHTSRLYERIASRRGHQKAIGAVARHLAEATYWILSKNEAYREPPGVSPIGRVSAALS